MRTLRPQDHEVKRLPVSWNQERHLFADEVARLNFRQPDPFHAAFAFQIPPEVSVAFLESAFAEIMNRHTILQAAFSAQRNPESVEHRLDVNRFAQRGAVRRGAYQHSVKSNVSLGIVERNALNRGAGDEGLRELVENELLAPFDFRQPPLLRAMTVTANGERLLLIGVHHLVFDIWSLNVLKRELEVLYRDYQQRRRPSLPPLRSQFSDFAAWQQTWLESPGALPAVNYWTRQWNEFETAQVYSEDLPFPIAPERESSYRSCTESLTFSPELVSRARWFAGKAGVSIHVFFLAGFQVVLQCLTGKPAIAVWANFSNRVRDGTESLIGWFVHTHLVGVDLSDDPFVSQMLQRVRAAILGASTHQEAPLDFVAAHTGRTPKFSDCRILFDTIDGEAPTNGHPDDACLKLPRKWLPGIRQATNRGLRVNLARCGGGLRISATCCPVSGSPEAMRRLLLLIQYVASRLAEGREERLSSVTHGLGWSSLTH